MAKSIHTLPRPQSAQLPPQLGCVSERNFRSEKPSSLRTPSSLIKPRFLALVQVFGYFRPQNRIQHVRKPPEHPLLA